MFKKGFLIMIVAAITFIVAACGSSTGSEVDGESSNTIRVSITTSEDTSLGQAVVKFKEIVEEKSEGKLKVEIFPDSQLGTARELTEQVQSGTIEMVTTDMTTMSSFVDSTSLFAFPYLLPTESEELFTLLNDNLFDVVSEQFSDNGFQFLGFQSLGYMGITSNEGAIQSPKDMEGLKMRVLPSEILTAQYEGWGAEPIPVDLVELYTALQTGIVSAQENPLELIYSMKFHEVQKYLSLTNHANRILALTANKTWFDGLVPELQEIVTQAGLEATEYQRELAESEYDNYLTKLDETLEVNELSEEGLAEFKAISEPMYDGLLKTDNQKQLYELIESYSKQ